MHSRFYVRQGSWNEADRGGPCGKLVSGSIDLTLWDRIPLSLNTRFMLVLRPPCTSLSLPFVTHSRSLQDPKAAYAVFRVQYSIGLQDPEAYLVSRVDCLIGLPLVALKLK